jgi:hypothetical protein
MGKHPPVNPIILPVAFSGYCHRCAPQTGSRRPSDAITIRQTSERTSPMAKSFESSRGTRRPGKSMTKRGPWSDSLQYALRNAWWAVEEEKRRRATDMPRESARMPVRMIRGLAASWKAVSFSWSAVAYRKRIKIRTENHRPEKRSVNVNK